MRSLILRTATQILVPLLLLFSLFLLFRGHNEPGGGFTGGLMAASSFALYVISYGPAAVRQALRFHPEVLAMTGLGLSLTAGILPFLKQLPFFTGLWIQWKPTMSILVGTPMLFDIGVYLAVIGSVLSIILAMEEEEWRWK